MDRLEDRRPLYGHRALVIGASAGGVEALITLFSSLPADFPLAVSVVLHIDPGSPSFFARAFGNRCALRVKEAEDKEPALPGTVYFAPPNYHLSIESDESFSLSNEEPVNYSRPAIDVLFASAAEVYRSALIGLVLTGASADGSAGLAAVAKYGGRTLVQTSESAAFPFMPDCAALAAPESLRLSPADLGLFMSRLA